MPARPPARPPYVNVDVQRMYAFLSQRAARARTRKAGQEESNILSPIGKGVPDRT